MTELHECEGQKANGEPCPRTARIKIKGLWLCHQHGQIAERDPVRVKAWKQAKKAARA
jgi:hypothetical protein